MTAPLTLYLDAEVLDRARRYAAAHGTTLPDLAEDLLRRLPDAAPGGDGEPSGAADGPPGGGADAWREALGPRVRALLDRPPPARNLDREDYYRYLEEKHR